MTERLSIVVGASEGCNLNCRYCYRGLDGTMLDMDDNTLANLIKKTLSLEGIKEVSYVWHGGEPTLPGLPFYEKVVNLQNRYKGDVEVNNGMQTNGIELSDEFIDFLIKNDFGVGVSLDGPKEIHDLQRPMRSGEGSSFENVMRTVKKFHDCKEKIGSISVVTKYSLHKAEEIYNFLSEEIGSAKFRPMNRLGNGIENYAELGITNAEYIGFLKTIFPLWKDSQNKMRVEPFNSALDQLLTNIPMHCGSLPSCSEYYLHVTPTGQVYSCGDFIGNPLHYYGNLNTDPLEKILDSPNRAKITETRKGLTECKACEYVPICNSGCMASAYMMDGDIGHKDYWCPSNKAVFNMVKGYIIDKLNETGGVFDGIRQTGQHATQHAIDTEIPTGA
jgi:uncharacterized protein